MKKITVNVPSSMTVEIAEFVLNVHSHLTFKSGVLYEDICLNFGRLCRHCKQPECNSAMKRIDLFFKENKKIYLEKLHKI